MDNRAKQLHELGLMNWMSIRWNLSTPQLVEQAIRRGEGHLASNGTLLITTGSRTGRSPQDRFIVEEEASKNRVAWGKVNQPISENYFNLLLSKIQSYLQHKDLFAQDLFVGQHPNYRVPLRIISEFAWGALFARTMFVRPNTPGDIADHEPEYTILHAPRLHADPRLDGTNSETFVVINLGQKIVLVGGSDYGGEIKKSMFSIMNYLLPIKGVFPMHCSANVGKVGDTALFFGLSGTGKTSLSADPERMLIGDDEHGWGEDGIFNFEGGCYAKTIRLSPEKEPQIYDAIHFGSIAENVDFDESTRVIDFESDRITENTRATYPLEYIENAKIPGVGDHPQTIMFLTADAFGVLPPISKLTPEMAMYHFLTGYTSKLAGTEMGVTEPQTAFSECFGAPFLPLPATHYAEMLGEKMRKHKADVWLVNTGWSGGQYGVGERMDIRLTRAMIKAALDGELKDVEFKPHPVFKVLVPASCPGVPSNVLDPRNTWEDKKAYDEKALNLARRFQKNFEKFPNASMEIREAGPKAD
jgi:phosphoenolpyruvate carboxykinase (ATP)